MRKGDFRVYVQDILEAIQRIDDYLKGTTFEEFSKDADWVIEESSIGLY